VTSPTPFPLTPWVRRLSTVNAGVYVLAATVFTGPWFVRLAGFVPHAAPEHPWTFLTYMFVHTSFLHFAVNSLMLVLFGPAVERRLGGAAFIRFYLLSGLGGPLAAFALALLMPEVAPFVGASAAVFGVALAFALAWPEARVFVFPFPWPVRAGVLVGLLAALALVPFLLDPREGVAHLAHLGGFLLAALYLKGGEYIERRTLPADQTGPAEPALVAHQSSSATADTPPEPRPPISGHDDLSREMDRVLDKISRQGLPSLTAAERRFLDEISRRLRQP
jgi:membrane associated rhomboid family serine protease